MADTRRWIAMSAASVLGVGVLATGAVGVASAMPLVDTTTSAGVEPISTVTAPGKALMQLSEEALGQPLPTSTAQPVTPPTPASASTSGSPAPVQNPAPQTVSPPSPVTPPSPATVASAPSAASVDSAD